MNRIDASPTAVGSSSNEMESGFAIEYCDSKYTASAEIREGVSNISLMGMAEMVNWVGCWIRESGINTKSELVGVHDI